MMRATVAFAVLLHAAVAQDVTTASRPAAAAPTDVQRPWRLGTDQWIAWEALHVAEHLGFWADQGLRIELITYTGGEAPSAFAAGYLDFATVMLGSAVAAAAAPGQANAVRILAEIDWSHGGDRIVAKKGLDALRGRRIGVYEDSPAVSLFLHRYLQQTGLTIRNVEIVEVLDNEALVDHLLAGRFDAIVSYEPDVRRTSSDPRFEVLATTAAIPGVMPEVLAMRADHRIPPAVPEQLLRGWIRAVQWCNDPANARHRDRIAREHTLRGKAIDDRDLVAMRGNVRVHDLDALRRENFGDDRAAARLATMLEFAREYRRSPELDAAQLFDREPLRRAIAGFRAPAQPPAPAAGR